MLFTPEAHERLIEDRWNPDRVRAAIREIVDDAEGSFDDGWPTHPQDIEEKGDEERRFRTVYLGGAGVVQALDSLQHRGLVELRREYVSYLERSYQPDFPDDDHERSLWMGDTGIRLVLHRLSPSKENADRLAELIAGNAEDERREVMWGSPGTIIAAATMHELTGEARWLDLWRESAAWLRDEWDPDTALWTQHLYGRVQQIIGPAHGFAGCILALARDADDELHRRAALATARYAIEQGELANWPPTSTEGLRHRRDGSIRVQWCHGAPGVVASLARFAPTTPSMGVCCARAASSPGEPARCRREQTSATARRATAMPSWRCSSARGMSCGSSAPAPLRCTRSPRSPAHALSYGRGRYTLWSGDPGTALYLADCLASGGTVPLP